MTGRADLPIRDDLRDLTPYGAPQLAVPVALNTNENPYELSDRIAADLAAAIAEVGRGLNRYPDRDAVELRKDLADYLSGATGQALTADAVWVANGSNEVIQQILQVFGGPGRTAMGFEPSYSMHGIIARTTATTWLSGARDKDFGLRPAPAVAAIREHRPDVVFLTSPNNPTGTALPPDVIEAVLEAAPGMVVVDEAYAEFARPGTRSAVTLLSEHPRLIVTRTMSKAFALAGARVGYMAASPAVVEAMLLVRLPYHLSAVTQTVARVALEHAADLLGAVGELRADRDALVTWLRKKRLKVADSDANFVMFGRFEDRHAIWQDLLDHGVLVREVGPPGWLRVTVGSPDEVEAFKTALTEVLRTSGGKR
ncbi:MAG: histidinol-phosphate transaminase [Streptosporangiales bacterium]|nr:histidinol-phosphate transaminase [Streptosporangiales bacterium]